MVILSANHKVQRQGRQEGYNIGDLSIIFSFCIHTALYHAQETLSICLYQISQLIGPLTPLTPLPRFPKPTRD